MGKSCCAVGCVKRFSKGSGIHFYRFPENTERRARWVAAVGRKNWEPTEYSWLCSTHFVSGAKSNNPTSPDYVPSVFPRIKSPVKSKRKLMKDFERTKQETKKRRVENCDRLNAANSLLDLFHAGSGTVYCEPHTGCYTMTDLSASDIEQLETECQQLKDDGVQLREESMWLLEENQKLAVECDSLKSECQRLREECKQLRKRNQTLEDALESTGPN